MMAHSRATAARPVFSFFLSTSKWQSLNETHGHRWLPPKASVNNVAMAFDFVYCFLPTQAQMSVPTLPARRTRSYALRACYHPTIRRSSHLSQYLCANLQQPCLTTVGRFSIRACRAVPEELGELLLSSICFLMHLYSAKMRGPKRRTVAAIHEHILFRAVTVHIAIEK
jgi:hypothetical protein